LPIRNGRGGNRKSSIDNRQFIVDCRLERGAAAIENLQSTIGNPLTPRWRSVIVKWDSKVGPGVAFWHSR
jgi:hypothetical protein